MKSPLACCKPAALLAAVIFGSSVATAALQPGSANPDQGSKRPAPTPQEAAQPVDPLVEQVKEAVGISARRYLSSNVHTPWQIMHGVLAFRGDYLIKDPSGKKISAIDFISGGATYRGEPWFERTRDGGRAHPYSSAYAFEGHPNQFLAIISMADLPLDHRFQARGGAIRVLDLVEHAKKNVTAGEEVAWTLWGLVHYLGPEAEWENKYGERWNIERLVQIQTREPTDGAACGGTHGLFALSSARNMYMESGRPLRGVWLEADQRIRRYIEEARQNQNSDGSFSSRFFQGRSYTGDFEDRLHSSGHTLEFLMMALPQHRLNEPWVRRGVQAVARDLIDNQRSSCECGALYHAVNGLVLYLERVTPRPDVAENEGEPGSGAQQPAPAEVPPPDPLNPEPPPRPGQ